MSAPLVDGIVSNTVPIQSTHQSDAASNAAHSSSRLVA